MKNERSRTNEDGKVLANVIVLVYNPEKVGHNF